MTSAQTGSRSNSESQILQLQWLPGRGSPIWAHEVSVVTVFLIGQETTWTDSHCLHRRSLAHSDGHLQRRRLVTRGIPTWNYC